ncbi:ABC transporter permease [Paenibacillus wynnii]|uniref:ABC transporter permease n=1 Tax=Paenibacillus wynnii TaxID=268407 RepID=A0A098M466_9BACL|nr:FtsX-like permease family protein [Paenibacillus wynnii]KGE16347.1 ABC transporter permease [Paenibacillus wynnii]
MLLNMLKKDFSRKKSITIALFIFILLSALLVSAGSSMIMELSNSLNNLFTASKAPHFVQMHSGELNQSEIDDWTSKNDLVKAQQTVEMINIDGSNLYLGNDTESEKNSIMDLDFVRQNTSFDLLLNLESQVIQLSRGEIAVPIYYKQQKNMNIGDKVKITTPSFDMEFTVVDFVRDVQMNPSIIHSKRFVVHKGDFEKIKSNLGEIEYLVEFQLNDFSKLSEFSNAYQSSNLPKKGPAVDYSLFKTLNSITDGVVAAVIIFVSILLNVIAILCIRFTILATIEEDYREIGVMKAIGISQSYIKKMYLTKYVVMAAAASIIGFLASIFLNRLFTANIMLYIGTAPKSVFQHLISFIAVVLIFLMVVLFCSLVLRRFKKISTIEALRSGNIGDAKVKTGSLPLHKSKFFNIPIFLGVKDVFQRFKMFRLLLIVFLVSSFIIIIPVNFLNTIQSPSFISYMGIGQSDIRIDLRLTDNIVERYKEMNSYIKNDKDVAKFSPLVTSQFKMINNDGALENISIETGDFSIFPLDYVNGNAPTSDNEIALSYANSKDMEKNVGDQLQLVVNGTENNMVVSGIYQDVTNGGRTAKALMPFNADAVLWYVVSLDVSEHTDIKGKIAEYEEAFYPAKVTHLQGYLDQTLGNTIDQLKLITILAILIAIFVSILITSLFLKMLVAKDYAQIAILKSIGFTLRDIRIKYVTMALLVLNIGIILGTIVSNTIGQKIVSIILSFFGASQIKFVIDPVQAYILCPLVLMLVVTITTLISIISIKKSSISEMIVE